MLEFFNFLDILNLIGHASLFANWEHYPHDGAKLTKHWKTISIMFYLQTYIFMFFKGFMVLYGVYGVEGSFKAYCVLQNILSPISYGVLSGVCPVFFAILNAFPSFVSTNS